MNRIDFQEAKDSFDYEAFIKEQKRLDKKRIDFVKTFPLSRLTSMKIDEYVQGGGKTDTFCYHLEWGLMDLGKIVGSTCIKFGIYYSKEDGGYRFSKKFGKTDAQAFENVKKNVVQLVEAGKDEKYDSIASNPIAPMVRGKILAMYYPDLYLNVFSGDHLNYFLKAFGLDTKELIKKDEVYKRKALVDFKNSDKDMKDWRIDAFGYFLYHYYPKAPLNEKQLKDGKKNKFDFETPKSIESVDLNIESSDKGSLNIGKSGKKAPDYEQETRNAKQLGDRGEDIVMQFEKARLKDQNMGKKPKQVSRESDSYGYDILSYNKDGSERYIEVKATSCKCGDFSFFYTANELRAAEKYGENYYLYVVFEVTSAEPKVWMVQNPFIGKDKLNLIPIKYKVNVKTK